jgi:hypothetical protein
MSTPDCRIFGTTIVAVLIGFVIRRSIGGLICFQLLRRRDAEWQNEEQLLGHESLNPDTPIASIDDNAFATEIGTCPREGLSQEKNSVAMLFRPY